MFFLFSSDLDGPICPSLNEQSDPISSWLTELPLSSAFPPPLEFTSENIFCMFTLLS